MLKIRVAACSEIGQRTTNEDAVVAHENGPGWYAVLCDGAGGHRNGAEAARRAVSRMQLALGDATLPWRPELLTGAVMAAHDDVRRGIEESGRARMHTTLVALCVDAQRNFAMWTHVGDSRLYRLRNGRVDRVTNDDSVVQRLIDAGLITPAQAEDHPHKNHLVAALGIDDDLEPHTTGAEPLEDGDVFLLCSDGWWGSAGEAAIPDTLRLAQNPQDWLLAMRAEIEARELPNQDNFSAIALWVGDRQTAPVMSPDDEDTVTAPTAGSAASPGPSPSESSGASGSGTTPVGDRREVVVSATAAQPQSDEDEDDETTRRMPL
ncbi:PP2C family protein-serine/threonine phosphatase [Roseateles depolymerans]|uniref:Protein phosphatase 2C-like:Protein phosphatase 2C-like n=1 Tax=Roseateles depolymerans TaxID=76731 RepID=A0A0U3LGA4_9BURK|nr:protein phosphatase 2C domain-containing protein [Roseateles depolymerans]ALV07103.1 Protein phosphatase 2C-like:Protein phosphatase 2C-like [Roseateles depolymerans]REG20086.1 serine/threonine protein phosphatase PrpC [Roseateles depolymerans]